MPEKIFLCWKTGLWLEIIAWVEIVASILKAIFQILALAIISLHWTHGDSENESYSVIWIVGLTFILGSIVAITMGIFLLLGLKHTKILYLKAWMIFAIISVFWEVVNMIIEISFDVYYVNTEALYELFIIFPLYLIGAPIVVMHINSITAVQNPDGEVLPKYEHLTEESV